MSSNLSNEAIASALNEAVTNFVADLDLVNHPKGHTRLHEGYIRLTGFLQQTQDDDPLHRWSDALIADNNELIVYGLISQAIKRAKYPSHDTDAFVIDAAMHRKLAKFNEAEEWVLSILANNSPDYQQASAMGEYKPTEVDLKNALCSVRATRWSKFIAAVGPWFGDGRLGNRGGFGRFMWEGKFNDHDAQVIANSLSSYVEWKHLSLVDILNEIQESSSDCQKRLYKLTRRYFMALKEKLLDIIYEKKYYAQSTCMGYKIGLPEWLEGDRRVVYFVRRYAYFAHRDVVSLADLNDVLPNQIDGIHSYEFLSDETGCTSRVLTERIVIEQMLVFQELLRILGGDNNKTAVLHTHWIFCLTDALKKIAEDRFSETAGLQEIAIKTHDLILKAVFAGTLSDHDLFTLLDYPSAWSVMFQAIMRSKEAFAPLDRGITPALLQEWNEYKACGLGHPRKDIQEFMNLQEADKFVERFRVFQENNKIYVISKRDGKAGRKQKLLPEVFMRDILPIMDKEFPRGGSNSGIIARCKEIGEMYSVSGSTIKRMFYEMRLKATGNNSGLN